MYEYNKHGKGRREEWMAFLLKVSSWEKLLMPDWPPYLFLSSLLPTGRGK